MNINREEVTSLLEMPLPELLLMADKARRESAGEGLELCNIMNATNPTVLGLLNVI